MAATPIFHVGILVADLGAAIERFSATLGLTFAEPSTMPVTLDDGEPVETTMTATYSQEGPPYVELVQGHGDALFSLRHGEGVHHLGLWSPDWSAYSQQEPARCLPVSTTVRVAPGDPSMWLSDPADLHGTRLEYVDERQRPVLEAWIRGEPPA